MSILVRLCQVKLEKQGLADKLLLFNALYTLLISLGTILNFICGKIIHVAKMATKDESCVDVDFAVCSYK